MMYIRQDTPGIDKQIDGLQKLLYPQILELWGLTAEIDSPTGYNSYARAYRNQTKDGYVPEVFTGGKDYKEVYVNDRIKALSFFTLGEIIPFTTGQFQANVSLIFFVNLTKIVTGDDRQDEKVRQQIVKLVQGSKAFGFQFTGVEIGIDNVFREYSGFRKNEGIKYRDMHPFHCFRLNFKVPYTSTC